MPLARVLVCSDDPSGLGSQGPCQVGQALTVQDAYLLDPTLGTAVAASNVPVDWGYAVGFYMVGSVLVLASYMVANGLGSIIQLMKRG